MRKETKKQNDSLRDLFVRMKGDGIRTREIFKRLAKRFSLSESTVKQKIYRTGVYSDH